MAFSMTDSLQHALKTDSHDPYALPQPTVALCPTTYHTTVLPTISPDAALHHGPGHPRLNFTDAPYMWLYFHLACCMSHERGLLAWLLVGGYLG